MTGETVYRLRYTTADDGHGNTVPTGDPDRTPIAGAIIEPRPGEENRDNRSAVIVGLTAYLPGCTTEILPSDHLEVRGTEYDVIGEVGDWRNPWDPSINGVQVALERWAG